MSSQARWCRWLSDLPAYHPAWRSVRRKWYSAQHNDRLYRRFEAEGDVMDPASTRQVESFLAWWARQTK